VEDGGPEEEDEDQRRTEDHRRRSLEQKGRSTRSTRVLGARPKLPGSALGWMVRSVRSRPAKGLARNDPKIMPK